MKQYIGLPENITFQRHPSGATLCKMMEDDKNWRKKFRKSVNIDGARILELCDGQTTLSGLVAEHNKRYPAGIINEEGAKRFLNGAALEGMVLISGEARRPEVRFAGSYEHYYPQHSSIELTDQCNYKCAHCYRGSSPSETKHLDLEKLKGYISSLWENGASVIELTGGEPLLYRHFFEILDFAYPRMDMIGVLSNGYYLQEKEVERLAKYKDKVMFNISLDSHRSEFHNKFRGKEDAFQKTVKAMELLGKHGITYRAGMSVTRDNFFDIEDTLKLSRSLGARIFGLTSVMDVGRGEGLDTANMPVQSEEEARKYVEYEKRVLETHKDFIHFVTEDQKKGLAAMNCGVLHRSVVLGPDGELRPCVMFGGDVIKIGNIYKQSFEEIFGGPLGTVFSKLHGPKPELCGDCAHTGYCGHCVLKGVKMAKKGKCRWAEKTGVMKYVSGAPSEKVCGNVQEPDHG